MPRNRRKSAPKIRILLADDHELVRRGIRGLLHAKRKWHVVGEASDGIEAIEQTKKLQPDIVILDVDMPNLNGLQAAPKIREAAPDAKIIALTLHESAEMVRRALEAGAHGFVLKSDLAERLVTALQEISRVKPFLTPKASNIVRESLSSGQEPQRVGDSHSVPTPREVQVMRLLSEGKANKEIAADLGISVRTAEAHRSNLMRKLRLRSLADLIHYALSHGLAPTRSPESPEAQA